MALIEVNHVNKDFKVYQQKKGFVPTVQNFFKPDIKLVHAVQDLSFSIEEGELVGFIGENGAGKSTTIKMMSGILYPTSGDINVMGITPYENRKENAANIGVIFGQRSRLMWDLPMEDSFELYKEIYRIDSKTYKNNIEAFIEILDMKDFVKTPIRQLSLGQRMKVELSLSMLHSPSILYLDEPTIGLDVLAKNNIRTFLKDRNKNEKTTMILTSHDMKDLDVLCSRIIMISKGRLFYNGSVNDFKKQYSSDTMLKISFATAFCNNFTDNRIKTEQADDYNLNVYYNPQIISLNEIIAIISSSNTISNIEIKEPDIEDIVRRIYETQKAAR